MIDGVCINFYLQLLCTAGAARTSWYIINKVNYGKRRYSINKLPQFLIRQRG